MSWHPARGGHPALPAPHGGCDPRAASRPQHAAPQRGRTPASLPRPTGEEEGEGGRRAAGVGALGEAGGRAAAPGRGRAALRCRGRPPGAALTRLRRGCPAAPCGRRRGAGLPGAACGASENERPALPGQGAAPAVAERAAAGLHRQSLGLAVEECQRAAARRSVPPWRWGTPASGRRSAGTRAARAAGRGGSRGTGSTWPGPGDRGPAPGSLRAPPEQH